MTPMEAFFRYCEILRLIPRYPNSISTPDIIDSLRNQGYTVSERMIQRDLDKMCSSKLFPFSSTLDTNPLCWYWPVDSTKFLVPRMEPEEALTLKLVEQYMLPLFPLSAQEHLSAYFELADKVLNSSPLEDWVNKVKILPDSFNLLPPEIFPEVMAVIYSALFKNKCFKAVYIRQDGEKKEHEFNPLGLVFRNKVIYMVASLWDYQDIKQFALHRFEQAAIIDKTIVTPEGFTLSDYIDQGEFAYPRISNKHINLVIKVQPYLMKHLSECRLGSEQQISTIDDGYQVSAKVLDSEQLRWWLRSFGCSVEVIKPKSLRDEFIHEIEDLKQLYS